MEAVVKRLKRAQGQIGGIIRMIEEGRDCQEIVGQIAAVSKAVDHAGFATISIGLKQCVTDAGSGAGRHRPDGEAVPLAGLIASPPGLRELSTGSPWGLAGGAVAPGLIGGMSEGERYGCYVVLAR